MEQVRSTYIKNLNYHLQNGEDDRAMDILTKVQSTFARQYADNPRRGTEKYGEWLDRFTKSIGKHPKLRRWGKEELQDRFRAARKFAGDERGKARDDLMKTIRDQLIIQRLSGGGKKKEGRDRPEEKSRLLERGV
jgi:hypothetical protein